MLPPQNAGWTGNYDASSPPPLLSYNMRRLHPPLPSLSPPECSEDMASRQKSFIDAAAAKVAEVEAECEVLKKERALLLSALTPASSGSGAGSGVLSSISIIGNK